MYFLRKHCITHWPHPARCEKRALLISLVQHKPVIIILCSENVSMGGYKAPFQRCSCWRVQRARVVQWRLCISHTYARVPSRWHANTMTLHFMLFGSPSKSDDLPGGKMSMQQLPMHNFCLPPTPLNTRCCFSGLDCSRIHSHQ